MVEVVEGDAVGGEYEATRAGHGAALGVASQVQHDTAAVGVGRADLDVPVLAVQRAQQGEAVRVRRACGNTQSATEPELELGEQLATEQVLQGAHGQQPVGPAGTPVGEWVEAAGGDQGVDVGVRREVAAPGVQGQQQAWGGAQHARVGQKLQQRLAHGGEQQRGAQRAVGGPQRQQLVRQREDHVEVRTRQQALKFMLDPAQASGLGAAWAQPMAAGVELQLLARAAGAAEHVSAQGQGAAAGDAASGVQLA